MSLIYRLRNLIPFLHTSIDENKKPLGNEQDLAKMRKWENYEHDRNIKNFFFDVVRASVLFILVLLGHELIVNLETRKKLLDIILQNIVGLTYATLTVAGIVITRDKK